MTSGDADSVDFSAGEDIRAGALIAFQGDGQPNLVLVAASDPTELRFVLDYEPDYVTYDFGRLET